MNTYGLVADIGGTNIRFALVDLEAGQVGIQSPRRLSTGDHTDMAEAAQSYLSEMGIADPPAALVFAVAGPVTQEQIQLTNVGWRFSAAQLRAALRAQNARLVNDYEAIVHAIPFLDATDLVPVGGGSAFGLDTDGVVAIVGPGTGLGVGGRIRRGGHDVALSTEGGHMAFAPADAVEIEILRILMRKFGRVSAERILSGPGLCNLHAALSQIEGLTPQTLVPKDITRTAHADPHSFEGRVLARFCGILGSFAGDVALSFGARQGVLVGGGILPEVAEIFATSDFRRRFEDKGRFVDYMRGIHTALILQSHVGLIGAAAVMLESVNARGARLDHGQ